MALGGVALIILIILKSNTAEEFWGNPALLFYTIFVTSFELSRLVAAMYYPESHAQIVAGMIEPDSYEPTVSFVIPCKNEEKAIRTTVENCFAADYPSAKIEVIDINDGSTDRTGEILRELEGEFGERLTVVHWKINRGKRHGMAEGFRRASGEIVVQLDSDSYIVPETFRNLIRPFSNPEVGAVCAHTDPENAEANMLTRMQAAYYFMAFRIMKAAESAFTTVFCCSGCSSAYRRSVVLPSIDAFEAEQLFGKPITWGDDRALTNWVLRRGFKTIYTDKALARTIVPETFRQFVKQQIRWKKGWFVNSYFLSKFIIAKEPFVSVVYFLPLTFVTLLTPFMAVRAMVYTPLSGHSSAILLYVFGVLLIAGLLIVFYRYVARENTYWPYLFLWALINMVFLSFLLFYALATIQNRKWGTR